MRSPSLLLYLTYSSLTSLLVTMATTVITWNGMRRTWRDAGKWACLPGVAVTTWRPIPQIPNTCSPSKARDTPTRLTAPDFINDDPVAMTTPPHAHAREVTLTCLLKPGAYIIIPNTFQPDVGKGFLLRVFSSWPFELRELPSMLLGNSHAPGLPRPPGHALTFHGQWEAGDENVKTVTITLLQEKQPKLPYMCHATAFHVYKVDKCERITDREFFKKADVGNCVPHQYLTRVSKQLVLPAGCYVVVPSTHQPNCEGKFVLSVAFD
uniref:Peptidase C2 calpain domain-containing protein n=1 Tax=Branchiostoma floridae TaxID=7739 RepID=C3YB22_BRAFL|eukprot:XP_002606474.1 hypothetical protein BRAFLDRAFT_93265 [Branchiostoma floridae]